jgi:hypothetical protein
MYENVKIIPVETIQRWGLRDKKNDGEGEFEYDRF